MDSVVGLILRFGRTAGHIVGPDIHLCHKVAVVCSVVLGTILERFVFQHKCEPLLFQYSCDSTPLTIRERVVSAVDMWKTIRLGRDYTNVLAARAFASPAPAGSLVERFALRALGVAALLAVLSVAGNYTALVSAFDNETAGLDDPVGDMIDLAS